MSYVNKEFEFPAELVVFPQALVGVIGLDTLNNTLHRATWDAMCNNRRSERSPVQFKLFPSTYEFLRPKAKKTAYELHIPKGILKRNWMHKHLTQIPAVIVVFYDLDWDDPLWEEKKAECVSRVQSIRASVEGRNSKICLVLIQKTAPLPSGEDLLGTERANALFQAAQLGYKALFILPHTDHLLGYTSNLEKAFYELASNYYQTEMRSVKSHREKMNKTTHQYLYVRHHFKLGFFSELRQDLSSAHAHYSEAYSNLLEVRLSDTNEFEVKTVAGYMGYKVCRVLFSQNKPRDAISHFKAHIEHYKQKSGHAQLLFQHHAWLSKQFSVFADLFDEMIHQGLPAVQTQHPGFYYHSAAKHAMQRKALTQQLCSVSEYPEPDPLVGWDTLEFYGQRAWRPCKLSAEPLDPDLERRGILALQYIEAHTDISAVIIGLLGSAVSQFKTYRCLRMRRWLIVQMADEYYYSKEYGKALTLLMHMLHDYREEQWSGIVALLLRRALCASFLTASLPDYLQLSVEALARFDPDEAARVMRNLVRVTQGGVPEAEPAIPPEDVAGALETWSSARSSPVSVDTSLFSAPFQAKAVIRQHHYDSLQISIYIMCNVLEEVNFDCCRVSLSSGGQWREEVVATREELLFPAGLHLRTFQAAIPPLHYELGKPLQVSGVLLSLGSVEGRKAVIKFSGQGVYPTANLPQLLFLKKLSGIESEFGAVTPCLSCTVSRREASATLELDSPPPPVLLGEWYPLLVRLNNGESAPVTETVFSLTLSSATHYELRSVAEMDRDLSCPYTLPLQPLSPGSSLDVGHFAIRFTTLHNPTLHLKVSYTVDGHSCLKERSLELTVVEPFHVDVRLLSPKLQPLPRLYHQERCLLQVQLISLAPTTPITILQSSLQPVEWLGMGSGDYRDSLRGWSLLQDEVASLLVPLAPNLRHHLHPPPSPTLTLKWYRRDEKLATETVVELPSVEVELNPLTVTMLTEPMARVMSLLQVSYQLTNHTHHLLPLSLLVEASPSFMFSGHKQMTIFLEPDSSKELRYSMYPLYCGLVPLPKLKLSPVPGDYPKLSNLAQLIDRSLPTAIFVLPKVKLKEEDFESNQETTEHYF